MFFKMYLSPLLVGVSIVGAATLDLDIAIHATYPVVKLGLGTPPVDHFLEFDTGSSTLWVIDSDCTTSCPNSSGFSRTTYNVSSSSTGHVDPSISSSIQYSGGSVTGILASDIATAGNFSMSQNFAAITSSTWSFLAADGFLGLASSSIAFPNTTSFFENMMQQGLASLPRFGIYIGSGVYTTENSSPENNGVLTLGGSREDEFACGEPGFVDLESPFQVYKVPFQAINVTNKENGKEVNLAWSGSLVADTGAGLIEIPEDYISEIYSATPWSYASLMNGTRPLCSDFTDDWSVSFVVGPVGGEQTFTVTGSMLAQPGYVDDEHCFPPFNPWSSQNIILGQLWLRNFYSVFDFGAFDTADYKMRMGFAPLKDEYLPRLP